MGKRYQQQQAAIDQAAITDLQKINRFERQSTSKANQLKVHGYVRMGDASRHKSLWDAWHHRGRAIYGLQGDIGGIKSQSSAAQRKAQDALSGVSRLTKAGDKRSRDISGLESWSTGFVSDTGK